MHTLTSWLANTSLTDGITLWLSVGATLGIYSILYKENPVYRMVEHIYIGAAAGYYTYIGWSQTLKPLWWDRITAGQWPWIFALIGGAMFYFIYSQRHVWISRIIFGALLGLVSGAAFKGFAGLNVDRIQASFKPLWGVPWPNIVSNFLAMFILLTVMMYFFFSFEHRTRLRRAPANLGRWFLMFAFGAMFGSTVMARMSLLIGRVFFLISEWYPALRHAFLRIVT